MIPESAAETRERLARLWLEAEPSVEAYVFAAVRSAHDAEDVVQQVALTVARRFDEYEPSRPFVPWALWIARSRIIDHYRKKGREKLVFSESLLEHLAETLAQGRPERTARQEALESCMEKLPEKSRHLLELRYQEDASMEEVAKSLGSTAASVRVLLFRVRTLLADCVNSRLSESIR